MSHLSRIIKVAIVAVAVGMVLALVACGTGPAGDPAPDAGLPECPAGTPAFCTANGVCTVDGMQCTAPHRGFADAGADAL